MVKNVFYVKKIASFPNKIFLSGVGFEPTPTFVDQNTHSDAFTGKILDLESGALDHSAILTAQENQI